MLCTDKYSLINTQQPLPGLKIASTLVQLLILNCFKLENGLMGRMDDPRSNPFKVKVTAPLLRVDQSKVAVGPAN